MIDLAREGPVFVLRMKDGENRFNRKFLDALNHALSEVENSSGSAALVTVGEGKFYSNGLDLNWLMGGGGQKEFRTFIEEVHQLFGRILEFPIITVAAMNGHAFAGGAMLALAHDFRVMRSDRGYFCVPEVDLKLPPSPAMTALLQARLSKQVLHEALVSGKRYAAEEAKAKQIVDDTAAEADVLSKAMELAESLANKDRAALKAIKRGLYEGPLKILHAAKK